MLSQFSLRHCYQNYSYKGKCDSCDVDSIYLFLEEDDSGTDGKDRNGGYDHRADGRGTCQLQPESLADEVYERLKECEKEEFADILLLYPFDPCICCVEQEQDYSC